MPLKTGESLAVALTGKRICELVNDEPIFHALRYVMVLVGLRASNLPEQNETLILVNYIRKHYPGHTAEEIRLAFEKAIAGELDIDDVTCYENFSVLYFAKIMNAYREWAAKAYYNVSVPHKERRMPTKEEVEFENDDRIRGEVETFFQQIRQITKKVPDEIPEYFKYILVKDGVMNQNVELKTFFTLKFENGAQNIYKKVPV